jgi:hypothetical protein
VFAVLQSAAHLHQSHQLSNLIALSSVTLKPSRSMEFASMNPIPTAILLFAYGVAGAHHLYRIHRLARGEAGNTEAQSVIREVLQKVDQLPPDRARQLVEALLHHHKIA